ncbi:cytochrome oxidase biogenesis protein, putative [Perkinsus marinus ATCC 50983]|uniref:Cytochrome oxidase biogenesis protein, putative n=2 Tax=Perkinsus marinus (strain ATCC 50983 / TXsc) TaxID=423536 RepID=C5M1F1_PERM5|nr:cytochrome oxidase biogenesis protein, putative [Perkinsus marinus ATCC 50983]EEQ97190.1 cytochrome oxidase biogenesis protein, putative [Perkinsus marinus ATCC 50983]|eukprot:XP_002764473.1 cytochrome oxidase biogenesis protein, putative [Perkinsus marinus ATCC 50983]
MRAGRIKQRIMPQLDALSAEMKEAEKKGSQQQLIRAQTKYSQFIKEHGSMVTMKGMMGMFVQIPIFTTAFLSMRQMSNHPHIFKGFPMETPLWLDSLALSDPIIVLPVLASALLLTNIEFFGSLDSAQAAEAGDRPDTKNKLGIDQKTMQKYSRHGFRALCVIALPATMYLPAGLFVYTCTNALWAITQNRILRLPIVEQALNIPHNIKKEEKKDETYFDPGSIVTVEEALRISKENSQRAEQIARMNLEQKLARRQAQAAVEVSLPRVVSMKRKQKGE